MDELESARSTTSWPRAGVGAAATAEARARVKEARMTGNFILSGLGWCEGEGGLGRESVGWIERVWG